MRWLSIAAISVCLTLNAWISYLAVVAINKPHENHERFVLKQIGAEREDQYVINTETGRVWSIRITASKDIILQPILYRAVDTKDLYAIPSTQE